MNFCIYKDIFGQERLGVHSFRIFDIAIVDLSLTIMAAYYFSRNFIDSDKEKTTFSTWYNFLKIFLFFIILGIIIHRIFCVNTTINRLIFGQI